MNGDRRTIPEGGREESQMQERNILITGGTDGQGKAAAHQLAEMGARLLLVGRNRQRGEAAVAEITAASGSETITFFQADLSLVREMRRVAEHTRRSFDRLDVLLHAAGGDERPDCWPAYVGKYRRMGHDPATSVRTNEQIDSGKRIAG